MPSSRVAGIVLAAGQSTRMGRDKLLLPLNGEAILRRVTRCATQGGLSPVIVVLDRERPELDGLRCTVAINPDPARGMGSSIAAGLARLPATASAAMILLADMPLVTADMIRDLIARYKATRAPLVLSDYEGVTAPPVIYDRTMFAEGFGRDVIDRHRAKAEVLRWPATALADIDRPDDYENLRGVL
jgi:molybdenum cofactor cytidylyltransferase